MTKIEDLKLDAHNFNKHTADGMRLIEKSINENKFGRSILVDKDNNVIAGNGVLETARKCGKTKIKVVETDGDELVVVKRNDIDIDSKIGRSLALADNQASAVGLEWDEEEIKQASAEWGIDLDEWDMDIKADWEEQKQTQEDDYEEPETLPSRVKLGDIWQLGEHRLICGDSTKEETYKRLMNGERANLVFTDPPYGCGFESKGVLNDNLNQTNLLEFNRLWIPQTLDYLVDNGSWYCWGIDESVMQIYGFILLPLIKENRIVFRNLLTWDKGLGQNQNDANLRSYACADEKCLFVMKGVQGFNNNADNYFDKWDSIRIPLEKEAQKIGLDNDKVKEICGVGMFGHWFTKSQWTLIPEKHYKTLQKYAKGKAFVQDYENIKKDYENIKKDFYDTRAYFNNTHENMNNVWHFGRTNREERELCGGHATPKPLEVCGRAIKTSSRETELVLDVFGGSGSTLIACEQLNRRCNMIELDPHYCDVIINRWETITGKTATKIE